MLRSGLGKICFSYASTLKELDIKTTFPKL